MNKYMLAVFDLDGTILNTLPDLKNSLNAALLRHGFPTRSSNEVRSFVGNGFMLLVRRGAPENCSENALQSLYADFLSEYKAHCADKTCAYDNIIDVIKTLRNNGVKVAVVSNKGDEAVKMLCRTYFDGLIDVCVGEKEGIERKPSPTSVNAVLKSLKINRENAVYIGDSEVDLETAKNADMDCISVAWGFRDKEYLIKLGAKTVITAPQELINLIIK